MKPTDDELRIRVYERELRFPIPKPPGLWVRCDAVVPFMCIDYRTAPVPFMRVDSSGRACWHERPGANRLCNVYGPGTDGNCDAHVLEAAFTPVPVESRRRRWRYRNGD